MMQICESFKNAQASLNGTSTLARISGTALLLRQTATSSHRSGGPSGCREPKMSREAAKKIIDLMLRHGAEQNAALAEIGSICAEDEFQRYKQMIGQSMGCMLLDVIKSAGGAISRSQAAAAGMSASGLRSDLSYLES
jgi:hypothetical protein